MEMYEIVIYWGKCCISRFFAKLPCNNNPIVTNALCWECGVKVCEINVRHSCGNYCIFMYLCDGIAVVQALNVCGESKCCGLPIAISLDCAIHDSSNRWQHKFKENRACWDEISNFLK